ncbi:dTDP-4-amino-4,6-dideoxygalactose transaminase [Cytobacillus oceanisediminis]|uniref:dTDP-4-amino-4,6-dideoxygalactose transaminase n=1 Tax=Cytobacillus oceanisediminis TaxID=665099 RepID=A0A2V2ZV21_9BACI|nr:DegT/DnrJ/EryC1/StrS family aminotransferase [Cytobacillus oceanisediminis]PWW28242.1 dTDP-4-amino-4,6-dideoxygalactose transaminase [Cytobacillus oceanisediminis]
MTKLAIDGGKPVRQKPYPIWPVSGEHEKNLLIEVLNSGKWGGSGGANVPDYVPKLPLFEKEFARFQSSSYGVSVMNGTLAITVALQAAGVKPYDEVIMPPYTFIATATAALLYGAIPVFVDVEEDTLLIDPEKVEEAITPKTKAIIAVHIGGTPANMDRLREISTKYNISLIEDAAQAVGSQWKGIAVGALGDLGTFSFQSSKNLTSGEGGMILSNKKHLADKAWSIANVGRVRDGAWYQHDSIGWNIRMTELQAAVLLGQMSRLEEQLQLREKNASLLDQLMGETKGIHLFRKDPRATRNGYHLYMFYLDRELSKKVNKEDFVRKMAAEGIPSTSGYKALNLYDSIIQSIKDWTGEKQQYHCPIAERMGNKQVIWITQTVLLGDEEGIYDAAKAVKKVMQSYL